MLNDNNNLSTLTLDFSEKQISNFLLYIDLDGYYKIKDNKIIEYCKDLCSIANYLDYSSNYNIPDKSILIYRMIDFIDQNNIYNIKKYNIDNDNDNDIDINNLIK